VLTGDFHVHGFPADGALAPWALAREARAARVDVIGVTNHNQAVTGRIAAWLAGSTEDPDCAGG
jgi:predicted metal-dependent phosphoesterase TrpH